MMDTLREGLCAYMTVSRRFFLRMRNVSDKFVERMKTLILYFDGIYHVELR